MEQAAISEFRLYRLSSVTLVPHVFVCDISGNSQKLNLENRFIDQGRHCTSAAAAAAAGWKYGNYSNCDNLHNPHSAVAEWRRSGEVAVAN